ncbi:MAG: Transcriptional repressor Mce3R [Pseudomonas sp.]|nr:MAG: Transcriptional repressor Mce3R [Pseudomonas sp.]
MLARPRILEAARALFIEQGLDVSLDSIATAAGTTRQTLYNHFASKATLLAEVFETFKTGLQDPIVDAESSERPLENLLHSLACAVQAHFYDAQVLRMQRLLILAQVQMPELLAEMQLRRNSSVRKLLAAALEQRHLRGEIVVEYPDDAAKAFLGAVVGPMFPGVLHGGELPDADELARLRHEVCRTFLLAWKAADGVTPAP